jgi:hypothetical protein
MLQPAVFWSGPGGVMETGEQTSFTLFGVEQVYDFFPAALAAGVPEDDILKVLAESQEGSADVG